MKREIIRIGRIGKYSFQIVFPGNFGLTFGPYHDPWIGRIYERYTKIFRLGKLTIFYQKYPIKI